VNAPHLALSHVRHTRLAPVRHAFSYDTLLVWLPMRSWAAGAGCIARNRFGALAFHDRDHGDGGPDALAWLDALLARHGIADARGEAWLLCFPRVLGAAFKPVSFWFCERADGTLRTVVAEVNNTFGERHCYLLDAPRWGGELRAAKSLHVSPFCRVEGGYTFRFLRSAGRGRLLVRIEHQDSAGTLLTASLACELRPATPAAGRAALARFALSGLATLVRIHWQALRLALRRVPFHRRPEGPSTSTTVQLRA
jgi:DUF1365 family protein